MPEQLPTARDAALARAAAMPEPPLDLFDRSDRNLDERMRRLAGASLSDCAAALARRIDADILARCVRHIVESDDLTPKLRGPHIIPVTHG